MTCTLSGNPYATGITYPGQLSGLEVVLQDGVAISTTAAVTPGVSVSGIGTSAQSISGANATVQTSGAGSNAVDVTSAGGPVSVSIGDVMTSGSLSGGVRAIGGLDGDVSVTTGNVTTTGTDGSSFFFLPSSTGIVATAAGTGNVTVNTGDIATAGLGASGVNAMAAAGDVDVTTGAITTTGGSALGVNADTATGNVAVTTTGAISTKGDGSQGIYAVARSGMATVDAGDVTSTGFNATGIQALSGTGGSTVSFDKVSTGGTFASGVVAGSTGGDVTVSGGSATATGTSSSAIYGYSDTGMVNVTTTGDVASTGRGGFGIYATSGTGDVAVKTNNVSTVATDSADTATSRSAIYASGANATVTTAGTVAMAGQALYGGPSDAVFVEATGGDAAAYVKTVTSTGDNSDAVHVVATNNAAITAAGAISAAGAASDALLVDAGNKAVVNIGSGATLASAHGNLIDAVSVNGTTINNAGVIGSAANGYAILVAGGPATINNSGTLSSDILLTAGNDTLNNSGTFVVTTNPDFGAGNDVFNNSGAVSVGAGRNATLTGLETFNNTGLVDLRNGTTGDTLTIPGSFTGSGNSQLGLDANLGTNTADRLILGGTAAGRTSVLINQTGTLALFNPGTVLVQAGAVSPANAFTLSATGATEIGLVRYQIAYNPTNFSYSLVGGPSDAAMRTLAYGEGLRSLWLKSADAVSEQLQARRDELWVHGDGSSSGKVWVQMHGSVEKRDNTGDYSAFGVTRSVNNGYKQDYFGGQLGLDIGGGSGQRGGFAFGVTGGYINSSMNFDGSSDRLVSNAVNGGVYASYSSGNFFLNALGKYDYYWANAHSLGGGFDRKLKGDSYGGRIEGGLRLGSDTFFVEPAVSVSYLKTHLDDFAVMGTSVNFDPDEGLRGKAGARVGTVFDMFGSKASLYAGANYVHEFKGRDRVVFVSGDQTLSYLGNRTGDYGEAKLGVTIGQDNGVSGFIEGTYERSFKKDQTFHSGLEGAGGRAGLRIRF